MNAEPDLFAYGYPTSAGFRMGSDTSLAASQSVDANTLRARVLAELRKAPGTADEIAARLGLSILSIRPRCTELRRLGRVRDSGDRRPNNSGRNAVVWQLAA